MLSEPRIEKRAAQPYVAIRREVKMAGLGRVLSPLLDEVRTWMTAEHVRPVGSPFCRYHQIDLEANRFIVDVGWPVDNVLHGDGIIFGDTLPAGRYAVVVNTGPYDNLFNAYNALFDWHDAHQARWQRGEDDKSWGARIEHYLTDPADEPDPQQWQAEIAILLNTP